MAVQRTLAQLEKECEKKGIKVEVTETGYKISLGSLPSQTSLAHEFGKKLRGKKLGKDEFIHGLRLWNLISRYPAFPEGCPKHLLYILSLDSPMLCFRFKEMDPEWQTGVWTDPNWIAEDKINGVRMIVIYSKEEGMHFYSRNISVRDYIPVEYDNIWTPEFSPEKLDAAGIQNFVMDSEIRCPVTKVDTTIKQLSSGGVITETNLQATAALLALNKEDSLMIQKAQDIRLEFNPIHLLSINGKTLLSSPWSDMNKIFEYFMEKLTESGFNPLAKIRRAYGADKKAFYDGIIAAGGEGIVLKRLDSTYVATESRHHKLWVKCKRMASASLEAAGGLGDTIDGYVSGFIPGNEGTGFEHMVGALIVSVILNKVDGSQVQHEIGHIPNFTLEQRQMFTGVNPDGTPFLKPEFYNKTVELDGNWISARSLRLMHPRFVRFREDKSPSQCVMEESTLLKMVVK